MLVETMLDLAGLDYDAPDRRLTLQPALPASWPHIGLSQTFACGWSTTGSNAPTGGRPMGSRCGPGWTIP